MAERSEAESVTQLLGNFSPQPVDHRFNIKNELSYSKLDEVLKR